MATYLFSEVINSYFRSNLFGYMHIIIIFFAGFINKNNFLRKALKFVNSVNEIIKFISLGYLRK